MTKFVTESQKSIRRRLANESEMLLVETIMRSYRDLLREPSEATRPSSLRGRIAPRSFHRKKPLAQLLRTPSACTSLRDQCSSRIVNRCERTLDDCPLALCLCPVEMRELATRIDCECDEEAGPARHAHSLEDQWRYEDQEPLSGECFGARVHRKHTEQERDIGDKIRRELEDKRRDEDWVVEDTLCSIDGVIQHAHLEEMSKVVVFGPTASHMNSRLLYGLGKLQEDCEGDAKKHWCTALPCIGEVK
jgi:hypothetical protein